MRVHVSTGTQCHRCVWEESSCQCTLSKSEGQEWQKMRWTQGPWLYGECFASLHLEKNILQARLGKSSCLDRDTIWDLHRHKFLVNERQFLDCYWLVITFGIKGTFNSLQKAKLIRIPVWVPDQHCAINCIEDTVECWAPSFVTISFLPLLECHPLLETRIEDGCIVCQKCLLLFRQHAFSKTVLGHWAAIWKIWLGRAYQPLDI